MIELHGWLAIGETYIDEDLFPQSEIDRINKTVKEIILNCDYKITLQYSNGCAYINTLHCSNHRTPEVDTIIKAYKHISEVATGSYGMIVSFDLDDTLYVSPNEFKTEKELAFPWNKIYKERLRFGTKELFEKLQSDGFETWIYTTSFRSESYIRKLFKHYGIKVGQVINGSRHAKEVQGNKTEPMPSKYPGKYRIGLHIDDDISVLQNGKTYGFKVYLIGPPDDEWVDKVYLEAKRIRELKCK